MWFFRWNSRRVGAWFAAAAFWCAWHAATARRALALAEEEEEAGKSTFMGYGLVCFACFVALLVLCIPRIRRWELPSNDPRQKRK